MGIAVGKAANTTDVILNRSKSEDMNIELGNMYKRNSIELMQWR